MLGNYDTHDPERKSCKFLGELSNNSNTYTAHLKRKYTSQSASQKQTQYITILNKALRKTFKIQFKYINYNAYGYIIIMIKYINKSKVNDVTKKFMSLAIQYS